LIRRQLIIQNKSSIKCTTITLLIDNFTKRPVIRQLDVFYTTRALESDPVEIEIIRIRKRYTRTQILHRSQPLPNISCNILIIYCYCFKGDFIARATFYLQNVRCGNIKLRRFIISQHIHINGNNGLLARRVNSIGIKGNHPLLTADYSVTAINIFTKWNRLAIHQLSQHFFIEQITVPENLIANFLERYIVRRPKGYRNNFPFIVGCAQRRQAHRQVWLIVRYEPISPVTGYFIAIQVLCSQY